MAFEKISTGNGKGNAGGDWEAEAYRKTNANFDKTSPTWTGTQAEYDALGTWDADTLYFITA